MRLACAAILLLSASSLLAADDQEFPYQAVVAADNVEVRCGPGRSLYVTSLLKRDATVLVHRHDPGGWYMIAPPEGSFSYVEAAQIRPTGSGRGVVHLPPVEGQRPERAIVWIGSTEGSDHAASGRQLSHGDEVQILGQAMLTTERGTVEFLKIAPPPQEFRWVRGDVIVPIDERHRVASELDPYQVPADLKPQYIVQKETERVSRSTLRAPGAEESEQETSDAPPAAMASSTDPQFAALDQIDRQYVAMMESDPTTWNIDSVEQAYQGLRQQASGPLSTLIEQRLQALAARKEIAQHYQRFAQLTSATTQRDAELAQMQGAVVTGGFEASLAEFSETIAPWEQSGEVGVELGSAEELISPPMTSQSQPPRLAMNPEAGITPQQPTLPAPAFSPVPAVPMQAASPVPQQGPMPTQQHSPDDVFPRLDGAGILQPTMPPHPLLPPFRLVAPDGRVLAYLVPERAVPLQQYVGAPLGVIGRRARDPRLGVDVIRVQRVTPVRLTP